MKKYGGDCMANPMGWAERYAFEERGKRVNCECFSQTTPFWDVFGGWNITTIIYDNKIKSQEEIKNEKWMKY